MKLDTLYTVLNYIRQATPLTFAFEDKTWEAHIAWQWIRIATVRANPFNDIIKIRLHGDNIGTRILIKTLDQLQDEGYEIVYV